MFKAVASPSHGLPILENTFALWTLADTRCLNREIALDQPVQPPLHLKDLWLIETRGAFRLARFARRVAHAVCWHFQFSRNDFAREIRLVTIAEAQQRVDAWIREVGVRYFTELTNLAQLVEEVGEVARVISRQYGEQSFKEGERDIELGEELADVLFVVICLANQTGIDLTDAFEQTLEKKTSRDRGRHQQNRKLASDNPPTGGDADKRTE